MREIKFRAWDKHEKRWATEGSFEANALVSLIWWEQSREFALRDDLDMEFVQYTGLKDKNGKEIYEGDIVEYFDDLEKKKIRCQIYYSPGEFLLCPYLKPNILNGRGLLAGANVSRYEVIGNIYENQELLEQPFTK